jgi:hypothetical protein
MPPGRIALYGLMLLFAGLTYLILTKRSVRTIEHPHVQQLDWKDRKWPASVLIYVIAIPLAFVWPKAAYGCWIFVAVMWLLPESTDRKGIGAPEVYLIGREPAMRISTSLFALCCQSGPDATRQSEREVDRSGRGLYVCRRF